MNIFFIAIPVLGAIAVIFYPSKASIRVTAVLLTLFIFSIAFAGLLAPHRLARFKLKDKFEDSWNQGALDTRDAVYSTFPILIVSVTVLTFLSLYYPQRQAEQDAAANS